jgi:hypothetical protein
MALTATMGGDGKLFVGEDKTFTLSLNPPVNMAGWAIVFDVRLKDNSPDPAIFTKTGVVSGVFNADPLLNTQIAAVSLTDTELNTVKAKTYRYSFKRNDDGLETVLVRGDFLVEKATAP